MSQEWRGKRQMRLRGHRLGYSRPRVVVGPILPASRLTRGSLVAVIGLAVLSGTAVAAPGPTLTTPASTLAAGLSCPKGVKGKRNPVLLVPGAGGNPDLVFSAGLEPVLRANRYPVCSVWLPDAAFGDIQIEAEYVVASMRRMAARSGRPVSVLGISQGGAVMRWALKWWPDLRSLVGDVIGVAPDNHGGSSVLATLCKSPCPPSTRQQIPGSRFFEALNGGDETPGRLSYSVILSATDQNIPSPSPVLIGERDDSNTQVQEICPGRDVDHGHMGYDAVSVALVLDALGHRGPARASRIPATTCAKTYADSIDLAEVERQVAAGVANFNTNYSRAGLFTTEPALSEYANRPAPQPRATLRIHTHRLRSRQGAALSLLAAGRSGHARWALPGARIKIAGHKIITNTSGRAWLRLPGSPSGSLRVRLVAPGLAPVTARVAL
jgi:pimeloyl-ACP methyl ester carboxylesterase